VTVELTGIEEISAALPAVAALAGQPVPEMAHRAPTAPDPEPATPVASNGQYSQRRTTPNPPMPEGRWPDLIFLTEAWNETYQLLRQYPEGLTAEELGIGMGITTDIASGRAMRLRDGSPLVELVDGVHRMTPIGADPTLRVKIHQNPSPVNKKMGWDRFMARPLRDGLHRKRRRS
jgi:hypothetical protein